MNWNRTLRALRPGLAAVALAACAAPGDEALIPEVRGCPRGMTLVVERPFGAVNHGHEVIVQVWKDGRSIGAVSAAVRPYQHVERVAFAVAEEIRSKLQVQAWMAPTRHPAYQPSAERPDARLHAKDLWLPAGYCFAPPLIRKPDRAGRDLGEPQIQALMLYEGAAGE